MTRERLQLIHVIRTDKAAYFMYDTETIQQKDCVNIEIERIEHGRSKKELVCEAEILEESFGAMGGVSFHSLVIDALGQLRRLITKKGENIVEDQKL